MLGEIRELSKVKEIKVATIEEVKQYLDESKAKQLSSRQDLDFFKQIHAYGDLIFAQECVKAIKEKKLSLTFGIVFLKAMELSGKFTVEEMETIRTSLFTDVEKKLIK